MRGIWKKLDETPKTIPVKDCEHFFLLKWSLFYSSLQNEIEDDVGSESVNGSFYFHKHAKLSDSQLLLRTSMPRFLSFQHIPPHVFSN